MTTSQSSRLSPSKGFTTRQVTVVSVTSDGQVCVCVDKTGVEVRVPLFWQRAKGVLPQPGENWMVSQEKGRWIFDLFLGSSSGRFPVLPSAQGTATLAAGTVTVTDTSVASGSLIMLTIQAPGGTVGAVYISARVAGASFTIRSTSATDTSVVGYQVF